TKVGILTITALTVLILGFNFLKGKDIFKKSKKIYAVFNDLGGLSRSNEVKVNGYVIGTVYSLNKKDANLDEIVATINLTEEVNIPKDSKAIITSPLVGSWFINIEKGESNDFLKPGDTLKSKLDIGILDDVKAQLTPTLTKVRNTLDTLNTVLGSVNGILSGEAKNNLHQTLANLNKASNALNGLLDNQTGSLAKTLNNAEAISQSLKNNTDDITATIGNAKKASEKLAALEIQPTLDSLNSMISNLKSVAAKLNSNEGTLGALMNDRSLYKKINDAILSAEILMDDMRAHPKRYVNFSIFGRKDKGGALTSPSVKDSIPK
ncbi:MAG TPA: MlaD family protein, partial [Chitinophagaceae bacterium]|nr:MlaD family protein [Chitinophagaceae bacterium]